MTKMTDDDLIKIIQLHRKDAEKPEEEADRIDAIDRYHGRPYGDEEEGYSSFTTRDLSETIDWAMPAIMRILLQSGNIVEFPPRGQKDEEQAKQETDWVNFVILEDNNGFLVCYDAVKEALMLRNGYIKHWWSEDEIITTKTYSDIDELQLASILQYWREKGSEIVHPIDVTLASEETLDKDSPEGISFDNPNKKYETVKLKLKRIEKRIRLESVPIEELRVSNKCRGQLTESPFVEHFPDKTRSDLLEMGIDKDWLMKIPAKGKTTAPIIRNDTDTRSTQGSYSPDTSLDPMDYAECYLLVDWDGDGIAELRKVITVDNKIPPGDEWNEAIEVCSITGGTAKRMPHRHSGESLYDDLKDLIEQHTTLERQMLDNVYRTTNAEIIVNKKAHEPDFIQRLPGGILRIDTDGPVVGMTEQVQVQPIAQYLLPVIERIEIAKENRTGVSKTTSGLDADILKESTKGAFMENLNRASQKLEMMARLLVETLFKPLALRVHELSVKHMDKERTVQLRGKFVDINPLTWDSRTDVKVRVGLGTGTSEDKFQKLSMIAGLAAQMEQKGLITPENSYNLFIDTAQVLGQEIPEKYITNPKSPEFQQHRQYMIGLAASQQQQGNPLAEAEKIKGEFKLKSDQMAFEYKSELDQFKELNKMQAERMKESHKHEMDMMKNNLEAQQRELDRRSNERIAILEQEVKALIAMRPIDVGQPGIGTEMNGQ